MTQKNGRICEWLTIDEFSLNSLCPAGTSAGNDANGDLDGQTHCQSLGPRDVELTMDQ
jgi:hypothetical protein